MSALSRVLALAPVALVLCGCAVMSAVDTATDVAGTVVSTTADVAGAAVHTVAGSGDKDKNKD